jgi:hypothetical protein
MAAFVAKQMVGNKLSAVKGEFCTFTQFICFAPWLIDKIDLMKVKEEEAPT